LQSELFSTYWSLSLEEQFYLLVAPLVLLASRRTVVIVMSALIIIQFPIMRPAASTEFWWYVRSDAFAWGVLIAIFRERTVDSLIAEPTILRHRGFAWLVFALALIGIGATQMLYSFPFTVGLMAFMSGILVFVASYDKAYLGIYGMAGKVVSWLGSRSYAIYLGHGVLFNLFIRWGTFDALNRSKLGDLAIISAVLLATTLLFAELTYRFIEIPGRLNGRRLAHSYLERVAIIREPARV
jgi:peptidoglycan/LPS O-acetylase OafA/YrhL